VLFLFYSPTQATAENRPKFSNQLRLRGKKDFIKNSERCPKFGGGSEKKIEDALALPQGIIAWGIRGKDLYLPPFARIRTGNHFMQIPF
jgi:hypothetical protein